MLFRIRNLRTGFVCSKCALKKKFFCFVQNISATCYCCCLLFIFQAFFFSFWVSFFFVFVFCTTSLVFFFFFLIFLILLLLRPWRIAFSPGRRKKKQQQLLLRHQNYCVLVVSFLFNKDYPIFLLSLSSFFFPSNPEVWGGERFPMLKAFLKLWNSFVVVVLGEENSCRIETCSLRERERERERERDRERFLVFACFV